MISVGQYLEAATRPNTERAYAAATRHFEIEWGGHLPATAEQVARYLAAYAGQLAL
ncbi:Tn3 family resolvase, partial [Xanthomonas citri pv. mangiferaeindicae]